jgi:hypothetical protein
MVNNPLIMITKNWKDNIWLSDSYIYTYDNILNQN